MAPSPELGQPKAPDKTSTSSAAAAAAAASGPTSTTTGTGTNSDSITKNNGSNNSEAIPSTDPKMSYIDDTASYNSKNQKVSSDASPNPPATPAVLSSSASSGSSAGASAGINATTYSNTASSNSLNSTNLKNWDDCKFKLLLDEAYRYRSPKDRENKSETFLQLLQNAESKEEESEYLLRSLTSRYTQGTNRHKHGGSLQDLDKAAHNEVSLDVYGSRSHQHHHNSRPKKYSSSVSSRQREGGSLPSNVNVSNCNLSICEQPFLNEDTTKRRGKNERTCSGTSCASGTSGTSSTVSTGHDSLSSGQIKEDAFINSSGDTIIDINDSFTDDTQHLLAHDSLAQGISEPLDCDEGTELSTMKKFAPRATVSASASGKFDCAHTEPKHYVDESVTFPSLERGKSVDAAYLHFDETYKACKSLLGGKTDIDKNPATIFSSTRTSTKHCDENGNSLNSPYNSSQSQTKAKKKKPPSERNTTTLNVKNVAGYRGEDSVEELLKFIENTDSKKNDKNLNTNKKKEKKKEKDKEKDKEVNKKEVHKVKKSNSLEELRSCTKLDEDDKQENPVTMRSKGKKSNPNPSTTVSEGKENLKQQNNKRGERRSWGTEELTYLGENNAIEEVREKVKEKEKKKSKENPEKNEKPENSKKKKEDSSLNSIPVLTDSMHSESAEFHVVTKKKKAKKRQQAEEARVGVVKNVSIKDSSSNNSSGTHVHKKYQASPNFTNDREAYLNSFNMNEPRRKSTSSVPPSEKSDSSDLDSVHSLPVESTSNRHHNSGNLVSSTAVAVVATVAGSATLAAAMPTVMQSPQAQPQSYADIARTVNANRLFSAITSPPIDKMDKWPSVSAYSASSSNSGSGGNMGSASLAFSSLSDNQNSTSKSYKKSLTKDFPYLVSDKSNNNDAASSCSSTSSTSTIIKQISYSQSLSDEKYSGNVGGIKSPTTVSGTKLTDVIKSHEVTKQTLQKSKSVESDNYYSNMDQYPALEKTVKRHATQIAVMTEPKPASGQLIISQSPALAATLKQQQQRSMPTISNQPMSGVGNMNAVPLQSDAKAKPVVTNNELYNPVQNATVHNFSPNPSSNATGKKIKQQQQANVKLIYLENSQMIAPSIVECNNAKNKQMQQVMLPQTQPIQQQVVAVDPLSNNSINVNINKKTKSEALPLPQQQQTPVTNNPYGRKNKKDKNQSSMNAGNNPNTGGSSDAPMTAVPLHTTNSSSVSKISNRPAVIILNDTNDSSLSIGNDFTFGDFNEEELRLFDNSSSHHQQQQQQVHHQIDDSGVFSLSQGGQQDVLNTTCVDTSSRQHEDTIHLSPHSDHGYSSSTNNRSILSESIDSSLCNRTDTEQPLQYSESTSNNNTGNSGSCSTKRKPQSSQTVASPEATAAPNTATSLGTNFVVASDKVDHSCINSNSISNHSELSYDPCIIAVNSVDINRNKSNIIYSSDSNAQQHKTQQLVNQILVNSSSSLSSSSGISNVNKINNNNCNISNTSGMSSNNESSPSLLLDSKISANSIDGSDISTTALPVPDATAIIDAAPTPTTTTITNVDDNISPNWDSQKKFSKKEINIRFVAPPASRELNSINIEKIVDFVGLAWEEILNRRTQLYNGQ